MLLCAVSRGAGISQLSAARRKPAGFLATLARSPNASTRCSTSVALYRCRIAGAAERSPKRARAAVAASVSCGESLDPVFPVPSSRDRTFAGSRGVISWSSSQTKSTAAVEAPVASTACVVSTGRIAMSVLLFLESSCLSWGVKSGPPPLVKSGPPPSVGHGASFEVGGAVSTRWSAWRCG